MSEMNNKQRRTYLGFSTATKERFEEEQVSFKAYVHLY